MKLKIHIKVNIQMDLNENSDEKMKFDINDQLFLETMLLIIRGNTIKFSSTRKRKNIEVEKRLENEIKIIEDQVNKNFLQLNDQILEELSDKKIV